MLAEFRVVKKTGSGAYGHVWKVEEKATGKIFALKKNFDAFNNSTDAQRTYREIAFLRQLRHENVIALHRVIRAKNNKDIYLTFEFMDIDAYSLSKTAITDQQKKYILFQVARALEYMHNSGLIHRDLKPSNILVDVQCRAKLCDFGLVRTLDDSAADDSAPMTEYVATRWYRSPELLFSSQTYSKAVDLWGFGCLMGEMMRGSPMFPGTSTHNQIEKILSWCTPSQSELRSMPMQLHFKPIGNKGTFLKTADAKFLDLVDRLLAWNPAKRLSISKVLHHSYFAEFHHAPHAKENSAKKCAIRLHVSDDVRLTVSEYRDLIYKDVDGPSSSTSTTCTKRSSPHTSQSTHHHTTHTTSHGHNHASHHHGGAHPPAQAHHSHFLQHHNGHRTQAESPLKNEARSLTLTKCSRSLSTKHNDRKRKGISLCSKEKEAKEYRRVQTSQSDWDKQLRKDSRLLTHVDNREAKDRDRSEFKESMKKCMTETESKKAKRAVNIPYLPFHCRMPF